MLWNGNKSREMWINKNSAAPNTIMSEAAAVGAEAVNYSCSKHIVAHRKGKCK